MARSLLGYYVVFLLGVARAQEPILTANNTAHCTWASNCADPIIHGVADACHHDQVFCETQCVGDNYTAVWCDGPNTLVPAAAPPGCGWHDFADLDQMDICETMLGANGTNATDDELTACYSPLWEDMSAGCQECLASTNWNTSFCLLNAVPACAPMTRTT